MADTNDLTEWNISFLWVQGHLEADESFLIKKQQHVCTSLTQKYIFFRTITAKNTPTKLL